MRELIEREHFESLSIAHQYRENSSRADRDRESSSSESSSRELIERELIES